MNGLNMDKMRSAAIESELVAKSMRIFKERDRGRQDTSVPRLKRLLGEQGLRASSKEIESMMREWQEAGAGRLVFSKGKPARFVWNFNLQSLAEAVLSTKPTSSVKKQAPSRVVLPKVEDQPAPSVSLSAPTEETARTMVIARDGFEVTVPLDLTPEQAKIATVLLSGLESA